MEREIYYDIVWEFGLSIFWIEIFLYFVNVWIDELELDLLFRIEKVFIIMDFYCVWLVKYLVV